MVQLTVFHLKLRQLSPYLGRLGPGQLRWFHYRFYKRHLHSVLMPFLAYNHLYGQLFLVFLIVNCPLNALIVVTFLKPDSLSFLGQIYLGVYAALQMVALFLIHLYLVGFSRHFHAPSCSLWRLYGQTLGTEAFRQIGNFQVRLQIANSIEAFNSKHRYGVTYGKFGLVTLRSFIAFLLLYGKFIMTVYRRIYL